MSKLTLKLDTLQVQSFVTAAEQASAKGTVQGFAKPTGLQDTNCSAIDACASALGCTQINCNTYDPAVCPSVVDACPTGRGCTPLFPC
jgi:hypothetical protein